MRIDPDNSILVGMQTVFDVLAATFFFLLCSLPLVTAGASLIAAYDTMAAIAGKRCGGVTRKFFASFRENLWPGCKITVLAAGAGLVLWLDIYACWGRGLAASPLLAAMRGLTVFALAVWLAFLTYLCAGTARYIVTTRQALHNALYWTIGHPLLTLGIVLLWAVMALAVWVVWFYAFVVIAAGLYGQALLLRRAMAERKNPGDAGL